MKTNKSYTFEQVVSYGPVLAADINQIVVLWIGKLVLLEKSHFATPMGIATEYRIVKFCEVKNSATISVADAVQLAIHTYPLSA